MSDMDAATDTSESRPDATGATAPGVEEIDRISLTQALQDFEVANARVMDLTSRLTTTHRDLVAARSELEKLKLRNGVLRKHNRRLQREVKQLNDSRAVRSAQAATRVVQKARKKLGK